MFCQLCGTKIVEGEFFCRNCGEISKSIIFLEDKTNWLKRIGFFSLGILGSLIIVGIFIFLINVIFSGLKSSLTALWFFFILNTLFAGLISVTLFELRKVRNKLNDEREKRRTLLYEKSPQLIEEKNFEGVPFSISEETTKKFTLEEKKS